MKKIATAHLILLSIIISQILLSFVMGVCNLRFPVIAALFVSQFVIVAPFAVYCIVKRENPLKIIRFKKISVKSALFSVLIAWLSYPVVVFLNFLSMLFVENAMENVMTQVLSFGALSGVFFMAFLPAVVEETIFRGVLYNTYSKRRPLLGIIFSALLFGLMHMNFNQFPYALYLGIVMAFLMEACDSILGPMIVHFTLNGTSTLLSYLVVGTVEGSSTNLSSMEPTMLLSAGVVYGIMAVIALTGVVLLVYAVFRMNNRKPSEIFRADHSDTAYLPGKDGSMCKNRMIDIFVILFMIYTLYCCITSAIV